jgi:hypothetical protein
MAEATSAMPAEFPARPLAPSKIRDRCSDSRAGVASIASVGEGRGWRRRAAPARSRPPKSPRLLPPRYPDRRRCGASVVLPWIYRLRAPVCKSDDALLACPARSTSAMAMRPAFLDPQNLARDKSSVAHGTPAHPPPVESPESVARTAALESENRMLRMMLDDVKTDRDHWRDMAESAQRLLTDQRRPTQRTATEPATQRPAPARAASEPASAPQPGFVSRDDLERGMADIRRRIEQTLASRH